MKKALAIVFAALFSAALLNAQEETETNLDDLFFSLPEEVTDAYLDSTAVQKVDLNNYWMAGVYGGSSFQYGYFNPVRNVRWGYKYPIYGFSVIRYFSMFGRFPNMGLEVGAQQNYEGYEFKRNQETGYIPTESNAYKIVMTVPEVFMLSHFHFDVGDHFKLLAKVGIYGGYRTDIVRFPEESMTETEEFLKYQYAFRDYDKRWSYGVKGGLGFGLMFDPFEFHIVAHVKWGWNSFWQPDYTSPYYYRFGYPLDAGITFGIYYQLSPRHGYSRGQLRKLARKIVEQENQQQQ